MKTSELVANAKETIIEVHIGTHESAGVAGHDYSGHSLVDTAQQCASRLSGIGASQYAINSGKEDERQKFEDMSKRQIAMGMREEILDGINYAIMFMLNEKWEYGFSESSHQIIDHCLERLILLDAAMQEAISILEYEEKSHGDVEAF